MQKSRYSQAEARIVYYSALLSNKEYPAAFPVLEGLISAYPDNQVLYLWVTEWFREQRKNLEGAEYFEKVYETQLKRSPGMARYALVEKANLQLAHTRKAEALQTIQRIRAIPGADAQLYGKLQALEKAAR
jgi:predicted Zn-dependent protease